MTSEIISNLTGEEKLFLLSPSCLQVLHLIQNQMLTFSEIDQKVNFSDRTIREALKTLQSLDLIEKIPMLTDMRKSYYIARITV